MSEDIRKEFSYIDFENKRVGGVCKAKNLNSNINSLKGGPEVLNTPNVSNNLDYSTVLNDCGVDLV